ncbi:MAG: NAD(P)-dependent oxidoreductase [Pseudomonadota bacterium]
MKTVGLFGLGLIGMAISERCLDAGYAVVGHDPNAERRTVFAQAGGILSEPHDVWGAGIVIAAVFDTNQLASLIEHAPSGTENLLVAMSTCDPSRMATLETTAAQKSISLVEAPISGTSEAMRAGRATLFLAGSTSSLERFLPFLPVLCKAHFYTGPIGNGNRTKLAINLILGINRAALAEGLLFAEHLGLESEDFLSLAKQSAAYSSVMDGKGSKMVSRAFQPLGRISQSRKDFGLIRDTATKIGISRLPFAELYLAMMDDCVSAGEQDLDNAAIINAIERVAVPLRSTPS